MIRRVFLLVFVLVAGAAQAAWYPLFDPSYIQIRPGETVTVNASAGWLSGIMLVPFLPMTFTADDPTVATIEGYLPTTARQPMRITGRAPGVTRVRVVESGRVWPTSATIVVAERELPVTIDVEGTLAPGNRITLRARGSEPDATYVWFSGSPRGLYSWEAGRGETFAFDAAFAANFEYWVVMTSPNGAGAASVTLQVREPPARRRAVR